MSSIFVTTGDGNQATYEESEVQKLLEQSVLSDEHLFWKEGMADWRPLAEFPRRGFSAAVVPPRRGDLSSAPLIEPQKRAASFQPAAFPVAATDPALSAAPPPPSARHDAEESEESSESKWPLRFLRLGAILIDLALLFGPTLLVVGMVRTEPGQGDDNVPLFFLLGIYLIGMMIAQPLMLAVSGQSFGKKMLNLRIIKEDSGEYGDIISSVLLRMPFHGAFTLVPCGLLFHFVPAVLTPWIIGYSILDALPIFYRDRCLHDYIAGTTVIKRRGF